MNFAVHPNKLVLCTFTKNGNLRAISIGTKKVIKTKKLVKFFAAFAKFDPSGALLILGDKKGEVHVFAIRELNLIQKYNPHLVFL